ncbi:MAG: 4Fe-4S binding protein [Pseudomonadota bacterium]
MKASLLLCNCAGTQSPDREKIAAATGLACSRVHTGLCTGEVDLVAKALGTGDVIIACGQEEATFAALAEETGQPAPLCVDIRDRAGWSDDPADKTPKIAALIALATMPVPPQKTMDVMSGGVCLVLGQGDVALSAAAQLAPMLSVTAVTTDAPDAPVGVARAFDAHRGVLRQARGSLGQFEVTFDGFAATAPVGRGAPTAAPPRDGAVSTCDLILDLRGEVPLFPAHEKRDGYLRADPGDPLAVARALLAASHMVGTFEKPLHIAFHESLCAHSRAGQVGCTRCLDLCPTGAIVPAGEHVSIDPNICAGCGACAAVCPSGAASYDDPPAAHVFAMIRTAATAYRDAGGVLPRLLIHDQDHGAEMIALAARYGRGLPADVIPLALEALGAFGHAEMLVALASGFASVDLLLGPKADREAIAAQADLASALSSGAGIEGTAIRLLEPADPDALSDLLFTAAPKMPAVAPILTLGGRRDATRLAVKALAAAGGVGEAPILLPTGAPYGAVLVNEDACTLCLSCASLCPPGALSDDPDAPKLRFREDACLQCGICETICPEDAITLKPQFDLTDNALRQRALKEEEPYPCIECGALFGVKSTIERIVEKLEGKHSMFTHSDNARLIRMCDDCRVSAQYHSEAQPFFGGARPKVRTSDDYLKEREIKKDDG